MGSMNLIRIEGLFRFLTLCMLLLAIILMATDSQTKVFFQVLAKRVTFKVANVFSLSVYVQSIAAAYSLTQLVRCLSFTKHHGGEFTWSNHILQWTSFLFDQMVLYMIFAANCAATEFAVMAIFGAESMEWMKLCNRYTRFCIQAGWSVGFTFFGCICLGVTSGISAFNLFRWYSPESLGKLKKMGLVLSVPTPPRKISRT